MSPESSGLRISIRRVALAATLLALVIYLVASAVVDIAVILHVDGNIDNRLQARLHQVVRVLPPGRPTGTMGSYQGGTTSDLDDAPIVLWWVPPGAAHAVPLEKNAPELPAADFAVAGPIAATVGREPFRLRGLAYAGGRLVAGSSAAELRAARLTLLLIEASLLPVVLITLYAAAWVIARRAATPVERARLRQLEFTADASHELRTPLSVIEAEIGLALSADRPAEGYREALERVAAESRRLRDIVEDLLWLARADSIPAASPDQTVELVSLAAVCVERFGALAARRGISVSLEGGGADAMVVGPPDWFDRLLSVLLDNACRYVRDGGSVVVSVGGSRDRVVLAVDDDGPGIAEADRQEVLQRFHRASATPGGAGLGLAIADAVVRSTQGTLEVGRSARGGLRVAASWHRTPLRAERRPLGRPSGGGPRPVPEPGRA